MKKHLLILFAAVAAAVSCSQNADNRFMPAFTEDFSTPQPQFFFTKRSPLRYYSGVHSLSEENTDVMLLAITPSDPWGPSNGGAEIETPRLTHFGTYSARLKMPDLTEVQPKAGVVTGFFTYLFVPGFGLAEIDFEWLMADPRLIYIGTWTSEPDDLDKLQRIGRIVNVETGEVLKTNYYSYRDAALVYEAPYHEFEPTDDAALEPRTIPAIPGYDASSRFHIYGFDWYPDRLRWWMEHPETGEKVVLWDYRGSTPDFSGIPQGPTKYLLNFWHTNNWSVETVPNSTEAPKYQYMLEADWIKYEPFDEINAKWLEENSKNTNTIY